MRASGPPRGNSPRVRARRSASADPSSCPRASSTAANGRSCARGSSAAAPAAACRFPRLALVSRFYIGKNRVLWTIATTPPPLHTPQTTIPIPACATQVQYQSQASETCSRILRNNTSAGAFVKNTSRKSANIVQRTLSQHCFRLCKSTLEVGFHLQYSGPRLHPLVDALLEAPKSQGEKRCARS